MGTKKSIGVYNEDTFALYQKLVATNPEIKLKGDTIPYTSHNGHMFSLLSKSGFVSLRLAKADITEFLQMYNTKLSEEYGVIRKEYVDIPPELLKKTKELKKYFDASYEYVKKLKPKPLPEAKKTNKSWHDNLVLS